MNPFSIKQLIRGLLTDVSEQRRLSCAIQLMRSQEPEVKQAYILALGDSFDKVVAVACFQLSYRGGADTIDALYPVLEHPSWRVRLEACKAFMVLKSVDERVVSTLEQMALEPEAAEYDAEHDEFEQTMKDAEVADEFKEMWGKIGAILEEARRIADG